MQDFAHQSAGGDDLIAFLEGLHELVVRLPLPLLRADEYEVEDREDRAIHKNHGGDLTAATQLQGGEAGKDGEAHEVVDRE